MFDLTEPMTHWPGASRRSPQSDCRLCELDGVADRRAGGVALDQVDVARVPARLLVGRRMARSCPSELGASRPPSTSLERPTPAMTPVDRVALRGARRPAA